MKRFVFLVALIGFVVFSVPAGGGRDGQRRTSLTVGGGMVGSTVYLLAAGMSELVNRESESVRLTAQTTQGFTENVRLVGRNEVQFGFTSTGGTFEGLTGTGSFQGEPAYSELRCIAVAYDGAIMVIVQDDITSIEQLAGRAFNLGPAGSNISLYGNAIFRAYGIHDSMRLSNLDLNDGVDRFVEGSIAGFMGGPPPYPAVLTAAAQRRLRILSIPEQRFTAINEFAKCFPGVVPRTAYDFMTEDIIGTGYATYILAHSSVSDDVVYEILSIMMTPEGLAYLESGTTAWDMENSGPALADGEALRVVGLKMHPGATRFWESRGYRIPNDIR